MANERVSEGYTAPGPSYAGARGNEVSVKVKEIVNFFINLDVND